jgi:hypothetical protein
MLSAQIAYRKIHSKVLFYVESGSLCRYYPYSASFNSVPLPLDWTNISDFVMIAVANCQVFCCYSNNQDYFTSSVNASTGEIQQEANFHPSRSYIGLIWHQRSVYAFCGLANAINSHSCSQFSLKTRVWTALPDSINARRALNPVAYKGLIVLANGGCSSIETFNHANKLFTLLPIYTGLTWSCSTFIYEDNLYILAFEEGSVWDLRTHTLQQKVSYYYIVNTSKPIIWQNQAYFAYRSEIITFSLSTLQWRTIEGD